jgi:hypothetical protein
MALTAASRRGKLVSRSYLLSVSCQSLQQLEEIRAFVLEGDLDGIPQHFAHYIILL